jgi:hypothetical protein
MRSRVFSIMLLMVVASARLLLQTAAMPPYAGLDELYHVAYLAFVAQERRAPKTHENSIPPYLYASLHQQPSALLCFSVIGERWPGVISANRDVIHSGAAITMRPYQMRNYEAQQPQIYYRIAAPLVELLPHRTPVTELRLWRLTSVFFAMVTVLATAIAGQKLFGTAGVLAAALLVSVPTWLTLVVRVSNDAFACAAVATAFAVTIVAPRRVYGYVLEALLWGLAITVKLYTWPVAIVAPLLWRRQRASKERVALVLTGCALGAVMMLADLATRTSNALGVVAFDRPHRPPLPSGVDLGEIIRVTIASGAWTSGQHWDALTPLGVALLFGPLLLLALFAADRCRDRYNGLLALPVAAMLAFAAAQLFNVISCVLARRSGNPVPIGGKEGWYWYVLAPVFIAVVLPPILNCRRSITVSFVAWLLLLDVAITEVALFHDYSGATSPLQPSRLFRWGPLLPPFTAHLETIAVGPLASSLVMLRTIHVVSLAMLTFLVVRDIQPPTR